MTNYIIDPAVFYWMNVLNIVHILTIVIFIIGLILISVAVIFNIVCRYNFRTYPDICKHDGEQAEIWHKVAIIASIVTVINGIIMIFVPDKITSIEMLIARTATYENTQLTVQGIKEIVDYIVQAIKGIYN